MKVIIYCRVSTVEQKESGHSLRHQEDLLKKYCELSGYEILDTFVEDYTGTTFNRPEWNKLKSYISKNKKEVDKVLLLRWDRFSRNLELALTEIREFREKYGVEINSIEQNIDYNLPEYPVMLSLFLSISEVEKNKITKRTKEGIRRANLDGFWTNRAPLGYKNCTTDNNKHHTLEIDEDGAAKVRLAYEMFSKGIYSMDQVRLSLKFTLARQNFINMLSNPVYIGKIFIKPFGKDDEQIVDGKHPSIIDDKLYAKVQFIRAGRNKKQSKLKPQCEDYFMKDYLKCPNCGKSLLASKSTGKMGVKYFYYHCNPCQERYRTQDVHDTFYNLISNLQLKPEVMNVLKEVRKDVKEKNSQFKVGTLIKLEEKRIQIQSRLTSLDDKMLDNQISQKDYQRIKAKNNQEMLELERDVEQFETMKTNFDKEIDYSISLIKNLDRIVVSASLDDKRRILSSIILEKMVFSENKLLNFFQNEFINLIFQEPNELGCKKKRLSGNKSKKSCSVAETRVELVTSGL